MPTPSQSPLFEQAGQRFNLDRLYSDLERTGKITPRNWEYLKGILCGLDQGEIAKQCSVTKGTVKTALTGRVGQQILELLPDKSEIDWKRLPQWLIDAGYGIGENFQIDWQQVCRAMLDRQMQSPTLNDLMAKDGVCIDPAKLFVSVGLIERKQKQYRRSDVSSVEQGSQLLQPVEEEIVKRFDKEEDFFNEIVHSSHISNHSRLVITGEPGAGKTTLLQKVGDCLYQAGMLPIWISLGKSGVPPTSEFVSRLLKEDARPGNIGLGSWEASITALLQSGKVWLLLDGADELTTTGNSLQVIGAQLREAWASQINVVLTCRLNAWDTYTLPEFKVFRTLEFDYQTSVEGYRNRVEAYIHQFFTKIGVDPQLGNNLIQQLYLPGKERIRDSVKNPLRLSLLCYIWKSGIGELPDAKAELYRLFVDYYYDLQALKHPEISIDRTERDVLNLALGEVAKAALDSQDSRFRLRKSLIESISAMGKSDAKNSLFYKAVQLGWLNHIGTTSEKPYEAAYAFFHPTFQEYFAALAIDDWNFFLPRTHIDKPVKYGKYRIFEPQWKEVIGLWLGKFDLNDYFKEQLLHRLLNFEDNCGRFYSFRAYFLAAEVAKEFSGYSALEYSEIVSVVTRYAFGYSEKQKWCFFLEPISTEARAVIRHGLKEKEIKNYLLCLLNECLDSSVRFSIANTLYDMGIRNRDIEFIFHKGVKTQLPPFAVKILNKLEEDIRTINNNKLSNTNKRKSVSNDESIDSDKNSSSTIGIDDLTRRVRISDDWLEVLEIAKALQEETRVFQLFKIVQALKPCLPNLKEHLADQPVEMKHFRYECIYQIIWYCAKKMNYSSFCNAWHELHSSNVEPERS